MAVLPVIVRELRAQARQPLTYWLRMVGGLSLVSAMALALWMLGKETQWPRGTLRFPGIPQVTSNPLQSFGTALFGKLNLFIFGSIWLFVPLAAADALSRERREGTLVLLRLTELRSLGIVVGKGFVHMLRSLSLFLTMAPWLLVPLLFGGVEVRDIRMALLLDLTSLLLAMAAGLLASTIPRDWLKAVILAEIFAALLLLGMLHQHEAVLRQAVSAGLRQAKPGTPVFWTPTILWEFDPANGQRGLIERTSKVLALTTDATFYTEPWYFGNSVRTRFSSGWQQIWSGLSPTGQNIWLGGVVDLLWGAALVFIAAVILGAWRISASWQDTPGTRAPELRRRFFTPRFAVRLLSGKLSRALTANPIGWLQIYSPSARLVKWGWCLFIIVVEIVFSANPEDLYGAQSALGLLLLLGLTFSATGSFRQELETGAFELLLVTSLREWQLIIGRVRGLWRQFFPALLIYGAGSIYLASGWSNTEMARQAWVDLAKIVLGFCALPFIGVYFSVWRWNFFTAWLVACLIGLSPALLARFFAWPTLRVWLLQVLLAVTSAVLLERRLKRRGFLQRTV